MSTKKWLSQKKKTINNVSFKMIFHLILFLLRQEICMIVVIRQFVQEGPWLEYEGGQHHFGQIHTRSDLLQQSPDQRFVFF